MDIMKIMADENGILPQRIKAEELCALLKKNKEACKAADLKEGGKYHKAYIKKVEEAKEYLEDTVQYECVNIYRPSGEEVYAINSIMSVVGDIFWKNVFRAYFRYNDMSLVDMLINDLKNRICYALGEIYAKEHGNAYTWPNPWGESWGIKAS